MKKLIFLIIQIFFSLIFIFFLDYKIGYKFIKYPKFVNAKYHHDLRKNIKIYERGMAIYTNNYGFKSPNRSKIKNKDFDVAFIGDSFTEGVGVAYENTFVGIFHEKTNKKVINLGVSSYSPSIYLEKIRHYLDIGFKFDELIVFIDISDIQDEAVTYITDENNYIHGRQIGLVSKFRRDLHITLTKFPLIYSTISRSKNFINRIINYYNREKNYIQKKDLTTHDPYSVGIYDYNYARAFWTYHYDNAPYNPLKIKGGINQSLKKMTELHDILNKKNIKLSIGIYPWPNQILYDVRNSNHVKIWSNFCETRCNNFFNMFDFFFDEIEKNNSKDLILKKYYITQDHHFNEEGNKAVAEEILKKY